MIGVISHLIANLLYAVSTVLGKLLFNRGLGVGQLLLFSCSIQVLLTSYIAFHRIDRKRVKSLLLLGFLGGLAKAGKFAAVYFADPGNVLVFVNLVVLLVPPAAYFYLKEDIHRIFPFAVFGAILGVLFIVQPSFIFSTSSTSSDEFIGYMIAFLTCACPFAVLIVLQRKEKMDSWVLTSCNRLMIAIVCAFYVLCGGEKLISLEPIEWFYIILQAACMYMGMYFLCLGMAHAEALTSSLIGLINPPLTFILQYLVLGISEDSALVYIGIVLTLGSVAAYIAISQWTPKKLEQEATPNGKQTEMTEPATEQNETDI